MLSLMLLAVIAPAMVQGAESTPLYANMTGPNLVAIGEKHQYQVIAIGGPGEGAGGNFSFRFFVTGGAQTNALVVPDTVSTATGKCTVNLTASSFAEDLTLSVLVTSYDATSAVNVTKELFVKVVEPIVISAVVVNQGNVTLAGVPVTFYVDDVKLYNTTIDLNAKASRTVVYNWTSQTVADGEHTLRVELDPNSQFVRFSSGGTIFTQNVWVGATDTSGNDAILIGIFILLLFVTYMVYKRPAKRRKK